MKIEIDAYGFLKVNNKNKYCMLSVEKYCGAYCSHFSEPDVIRNLGDYKAPDEMKHDGTDTMIDITIIRLCHSKNWFCKVEDFIDNRVKVSNA